MTFGGPLCDSMAAALPESGALRSPNHQSSAVAGRALGRSRVCPVQWITQLGQRCCCLPRNHTLGLSSSAGDWSLPKPAPPGCPMPRDCGSFQSAQVTASLPAAKQLLTPGFVLLGGLSERAQCEQQDVDPAAGKQLWAVLGSSAN